MPRKTVAVTTTTTIEIPTVKSAWLELFEMMNDGGHYSDYTIDEQLQLIIYRENFGRVDGHGAPVISGDFFDDSTNNVLYAVTKTPEYQELLAKFTEFLGDDNEDEEE